MYLGYINSACNRKYLLANTVFFLETSTSDYNTKLPEDSKTKEPRARIKIAFKVIADALSIEICPNSIRHQETRIPELNTTQPQYMMGI